MQTPIYLDYAATTPIDPVVRDAMLPFLGEYFGNASSVHQAGQVVRRAVDLARDQVADAIQAHPSEIYFTSGGTEADNTALVGVLLAARARNKNHLVTSVIEHHAVLDCAHFVRDALGFSVTLVAPDETGLVSAASIADAVTDRTALVSVMHANNEIGTIQPISEIADAVHARGALLHTDAVQTLGQLPLDTRTLGADLLTLSAHKIYGPKGAGALWVKRGVQFTPLLHGGQQEREKRAGTENAAAIVGFGKACELLPTWRDETAARLTVLRDQFIRDVLQTIPGSRLNGHPTLRLSNNANFAFEGVDGESLLLSLDMAGVCVSGGSACASGSIDPSHVLLALGLPLALAKSGVRFSMGRNTTERDLGFALNSLANSIRSLRR